MATAAGGAVLAVALAFVSNADASHQYGSAVRCDGQVVRQVQIVARSSEGAIFRKLKPGPGGRRVSVAYGCLRRAGPVTRLGFATRVREPKLAGGYVAFTRILYVSEFGSSAGIGVVDLRTGRTTVDEPGQPGSTEDSGMGEFVIKRNGSVGWIGSDDAELEFSVWRIDATAPGPQRLDAGPQIDAESMRLSADRRLLTWRNAGADKSAPLD